MIRHTGKLFFTLLLSFLGFSDVHSQTPNVYRWEQIDSQSFVQDLYDCTFVNDSIVLAVGASGVVRRGVPSGSFPVVAGQFGRPALRSISFDSQMRFVCAGDSGLVGYSSDSGRTWRFNQHPEIGNIKQIIVVSSTASIAATDRGLYRILETGETSKLVDGVLAGVSMLASGMITVGYQDGRVDVSEDNGNTWAEDSGLSSSWPIVKVVNDGNRSLVLHKRFVTWRNSIDGVDTSFIPSDKQFVFTGLSVDGARWWATGMEDALGHAYSLDSGRTWSVSNGFLIRASNAISTRRDRLFAVGQRGTFVYGLQDSAVTASFRLSGFLPASVEQPINHVKSIGSLGDSIYVLREKPVISVVRYHGKVDTLFTVAASNGIEAQALWIQRSRLTMILDTIGWFETASGWITKRKFRICTRGPEESAFSIIDAPNWDLHVTTSFVDADGSVFVGCEGLPYVFRYNSTSGMLDSLKNIPLTSVNSILGNDGVLLLVGRGSVSTSFDHGDSWEIVQTPLPWTPHNSCMSSAGRLFIARLDVNGSNRRLRVSTSDDLGQSWQSRVDQQIAGVIQSLAHFEADGKGRVICSGLGNTLLLSLDNGQSFHEVAAPTENTGTIYASTFVGDESIAVGGNQDVLMRGRLAITSSVVERDPAFDAPRTDSIVVSVTEYDVQGRMVGSYGSTEGFTIHDYLARTRNAASGRTFLRCVQADGSQIVVSTMR